MSSKTFELWCKAATAGIRFKPDRKAVYAELMGHLEDHRDALMDKGMTEEEATQAAKDAMGDATEVGCQLSAVHRPFWGYVQRVCQVLLAVLLVLGAMPIWNYFSDLYLYDKPNLRKFEIYDAASYGGDTGRQLLHLSRPEDSFCTDGSRFAVTDAAVYTEYSEHYQKDVTRLYVLIRQQSLLPQTEHESYFSRTPSGVTAYFSARDSLGNQYTGWRNPLNEEDHLMYSTSVQSGLFTQTHELWINDFPTDAEWVEITYERDGRYCSLHIDLTGGDRT